MRAAWNRYRAVNFVFATTIAALASATFAAQLYVAPSGSNAGNCQTMATPCQTIAYALAQAAASG